MVGGCLLSSRQECGCPATDARNLRRAINSVAPARNGPNALRDYRLGRNMGVVAAQEILP
jgi:hypothetical protein